MKTQVSIQAKNLTIGKRIVLNTHHHADNLQDVIVSHIGKRCRKDGTVIYAISLRKPNDWKPAFTLHVVGDFEFDVPASV